MARLTDLAVVPSQQFRRYILVGMTAFTIEYLFFFLMFDALGAPVLVAHSLSFCCGIITSFSLNRQWTFGQTQFNRRIRHQFMLYCLLGLFNLVATNLVLDSLSRVHLDPHLGKVFVMALVVGWNFILFKTVIFRRDRSSDMRMGTRMQP